MLIFAWNLPPDVSEDNFRRTFEAFGQVNFAIISSTILKGGYAGNPGRFAFVQMPDRSEAQAAIRSLNRKNLCGQRLIIYESSEN